MHHLFSKRDKRVDSHRQPLEGEIQSICMLYCIRNRRHLFLIYFLSERRMSLSMLRCYSFLSKESNIYPPQWLDKRTSRILCPGNNHRITTISRFLDYRFFNDPTIYKSSKESKNNDSYQEESWNIYRLAQRQMEERDRGFVTA